MTIEADRIHSESVKISNSIITTIVIIGLIMAAVIIGVSVIPALTTSSAKGHYTNISELKRALCTAKVLELARKGMIQETGGYYGGLSECMAMKSNGSIYGEAGAA